MDYHVGTDGLPVEARHQLLEALIYRSFAELPRVKGIEQWGDAGTPERLAKLANCLAVSAHVALLRAHPPKAAVADWESDLGWLQQRFSAEIVVS